MCVFAMENPPRDWWKESTHVIHHGEMGERAVAGRNNTSKTSERTEQQKGVKMNLIVVDVHEGRM